MYEYMIINMKLQICLGKTVKVWKMSKKGNQISDEKKLKNTK